MPPDKKYDLFISHASEDKDNFVRPLGTILMKLGVRVWYDEFSMQWGDNLSESIDKGLKDSRYGLLVLSKHFLSKKWTDYEYRSLLIRQIDEKKVILPLWYGVGEEEVKEYSPFLAGIKAVAVGEGDYQKLIPLILSTVRPDIWRELWMSDALRKLESEGEHKVVELSEIKAPQEKQSTLSRQQLVRSKAVFYGIGRHEKLTFQRCVELYERDLIPERELQRWEIMNACYLEMLDRYPEATELDREDYFRVLLAFSLGGFQVPKTGLSDSILEEILELWKVNDYDF